MENISNKRMGQQSAFADQPVKVVFGQDTSIPQID